MPITSSAKKALRASDKKRVNNLRTSAAITDPLKKFRKLVVAKDKKAALALAPTLYKALDKAAKRHYIKKNTASRSKARIMSAINKLS
jgi:ribosomal protein S20